MRGSKSRSALAWWLGVTLLAQGAVGSSAEPRRHGAHVHGIGHLDLVIEGGELHLELVTPAGDLVGFEHSPATDAEHGALARAVAMLKDGERLFRLPADAGCRPREVTLASPLLGLAEGPVDTDHDHEPGRHGDEPAAHADLHASYRFGCERAEKLTRIEVGLFEHFPAIRRLEVQLVTERAQRAASLTADSPVLTL